LKQHGMNANAGTGSNNKRIPITIVAHAPL